MDPSEPGEKCLPEMGLSGWMKKTMERSYDLTDFCNSPPADGFFHPNLQKGNNAGVAGRGNCGAESIKKEDQTRTCTIMGGVLSINNQPITRHLTHTLSDPSMYHHQTAGMNNVGGGVCNSIGGDETMPHYLKPVVSGISTTPFTKQLSLGLQQNMNNAGVGTGKTITSGPGDQQMLRINNASSSAEEVRNWTNSSDRREMFRSTDNVDLNKSHPSDDSAPTPVDHIVSSSRYTPTVARRTGNPFFTGGAATDDDSSNSSSSWLFRPGKKIGEGGTFQSDKLYEAKVEFQSQPNSKMSKKTVRYVPRPSELRELNFWSPTSM